MRAIPRRLHQFFWDVDPRRLHWPEDQEVVTARILAVGDLPAIRWLRRRLGDDALRAWILRTRARGLSPQQIAYWSAVLDLPPATTRQLTARARGPGWIW